MVYDSSSALALADSEEQVRIFLHHMLPTERSYGMLTLIVEHNGMSGNVMATMKSLVDRTITLSDSADRTPQETRSTSEGDGQ